MSNETMTESDTPISVFLVLHAIPYEGDELQGVFLDREKAEALRNELESTRPTFGEFRVEEWEDGAVEKNRTANGKFTRSPDTKQ